MFRLIDTAGIREAQDAMEKIGVEKTFEKIRQSGILMYVFDISAISPAEVKADIEKLRQEGTPVLMVGNKTDLLRDADETKKFGLNGNAVFISSRQGDNIQEIKTRLISLISDKDFQSEDTVVTNTRHHEALLHARAALQDVLNGIDSKISGELLALDIRRALDALGEISGAVTTDSILDSIFTRFCIGK
jgi:tRNA modification GTPase